MSFSRIEAQASAVAVLQRALANDRLAQAYLFAGPDGVGKQAAALALARAALCETKPGEGCETCDICTRISGGMHPDVRIFAPRDEGDRNLQVEYLRNEVLPLTKFAPFEGRAAFFIFPEADVSFPPHHAEAANALLKTLEEPRARVCFVLLSERPDRLLSTIRSRCQRVRFAPLPPAVLDRVLAARDVPLESRRAAIALARGRASRAIQLAESDRAQHMLDWALRIDQAIATKQAGNALEVSEELARLDDLDLVLESLALFYRDVAASALGLPAESLSFEHPAIAERASSLGARRAAERVAALGTLTDDLRRNANPQIALDGFLVSCFGSA